MKTGGTGVIGERREGMRKVEQKYVSKTGLDVGALRGSPAVDREAFDELESEHIMQKHTEHRDRRPL